MNSLHNLLLITENAVFYSATLYECLVHIRLARLVRFQYSIQAKHGKKGNAVVSNPVCGFLNDFQNND